MRPASYKGFTLIELITVIVLIGALAVLGAGLFSRQSDFTPMLASQQLAGAVRLAQQAALAGSDHDTVSIRQTAADFEFVVGQGTAQEEIFSVSREGASLSANIALPHAVSFDAQGRPSPRQNRQYTISGGSSWSLCLSSLGAVYLGTCQ